MRVMVFVKAAESGEGPMQPTPETLAAFEAMDRFTQELVDAGIFVAAAGLKPSAAATRIVCDGADRTVVAGPFAASPDLVAGFSIWEVADMAQAVAWAMRCPQTVPGRSEIEIRPFYEAADLAGFVTPEELSAPRDGERGTFGVA